uniref:hypothetical protein n=1 Tax=Bradyrhizobium sp. (strain ORS 278) TaxID=114615 RepID=UPI0012FF515A|nr:hypothetical protein [Bradyrhizobium sp. ORS 278]
MLLRFPSRVRIHFERACSPGFGALAPVDFEDCVVQRQSRDFPRSDMLQALSSTCLSEIQQLLPSRARHQACLLRPLSFAATARAKPSMGMGCWSFTRSPAPSSMVIQSDHPIEIDTVLFERADWARHAATITANMPQTLAPHAFIGAESRSDDPMPAFDLLARPVAQVKECSRLSFIMLDTLAAGERAIFGRESFPDTTEFFRACADLLAMLPPALRSHTSFAAGFSRPIAGALIQWIDDSVPPARPGALTAQLIGRDADLTTDDISRRFQALSTADDTVGAHRVLCPDRAGRRRFASLSSGGGRRAEVACAWQTFAGAIEDKQPTIAPALTQSAASLIATLFEGASVPASLPALSSAGRHLLMVRLGRPLPMADSAALEDSIDAIEQTLAAAKWLADRSGWTSSLDALSKASISALRRITIDRPDADIGINSSLVRAIARAPHCRRIVARLIGIGDQAVADAISEACTVAGTASSQLRSARDRLAHELFLVAPVVKSAPRSPRREIAIATVRLSLPPAPSMPVASESEHKTPTRTLASTT